jgi:hypothetical protein
LAKGNAYASTVPLTHSSDLKTMEEIFGLPAVNNPIPAPELGVDGSFSHVTTANDLSDLLVAGAIPAPPSYSIVAGGFSFDPASQHLKQVVRIQNSGSTAVAGPLFLVLDNLSGNASLANAEGTTSVLAPLGSPYLTVPIAGTGLLGPNESRTVTLEFAVTSSAPITYDTRLLAVLPAP